MSIGQRLRKLRQESGLSQEYVAVRSGYSRSFIANVEDGRRMPCPFSLDVIMDTLDVSNRSEIIAAFFEEATGRRVHAGH